MAFTTVISRVPDAVQESWGKHRSGAFDFNIQGTYVAGGLKINAADVGMKFFTAVDCVGGDVSLGTYFPVLVYTYPATAGTAGLPTSVLLAFYTATGVEATGAISPTINIRLQFIGG